MLSDKPAPTDCKRKKYMSEQERTKDNLIDKQRVRREKRKKKKKLRVNVLRFSMTVFIVVLILVFAFSIKNIVGLHREHNRLEKEETGLSQQKAKLERELKHINDDNYIEEQARMKLKLVKPGEIIYVIGEDKKDK